MTFIPKDYKIPQASGNFAKLQEGETEILALDSIIHGYEYWNLENKPVRSSEYPKDVTDGRVDTDGRVRVKVFWAFPVWNVTESRLQVLEITQKSIMGALQALAQSDKWGDPVMAYTISITRSGEGLETEYHVQANPANDGVREMIAGAQQAYSQAKADGFDITRLYDGGDPFKA